MGQASMNLPKYIYEEQLRIGSVDLIFLVLAVLSSESKLLYVVFVHTIVNR